MKKILSVVSLVVLVGVQTFAHPGSHDVTCRSISAAGVKPIEFTLTRSNGVGWAPPSWTVVMDKKKYKFEPSDEMKLYGETVRDVALGVIYITADNINDGKGDQSSLALMAVPSSVRQNGRIPTWSFKHEKDPCYDSNGSATFQAIFSGMLQPAGAQTSTEIAPVMMACKLQYDSGMAC